MLREQWINLLDQYGITESNNSELFEVASLVFGHGDQLAHLLSFLKEIGANSFDDYDLYLDIMRSPSQAVNYLTILKILKESGVSFVHHTTAYHNAMSFSNALPSLKASMDLLKRHHLELPACIEHYECVFSNVRYNELLWPQVRFEQFLQGIDNVLNLVESSGAVLPEHRWLSLLVMNHRYYINVHPDIFTLFQEMDITPAKNRKIFEAVLGDLYDTQQLRQNYQTLQNMGFDPVTNEVIYVAASHKDITSSMIVTVYEKLKDLGISFTSDAALSAAAIKNAKDIDLIVQNFSILKDLGALYPEHKSLYLAIANRGEHLDVAKMSQGFAALKSLGFSMSADEAVYETLINSLNADKLATAVQLLKERGAVFPEHREIFLATINALAHAHALPDIIAWLHSMNADCLNQPELYLAAIKKLNYSQKLLSGWSVLKQAGFTFADKELYLLAAKQAYFVESLDTVFTSLTEIGFTLSSHKDLVAATINGLCNSYFLIPILSSMKNLGINPVDSKVLFMDAVTYSTRELQELLEEMHSLGFSMAEQPELISTIISGNRYSLNAHVLSWLKSRGGNVKDHSYLYRAFLLDSPYLCEDPYILKKVENAVDSYLQDKKLLGPQEEGFSQQTEEIQKIISSTANKHDDFAQGPLNKSVATKKFQNLLKRMASEGIEHIEISYDNQSSGYVLKFPDEVIYLNALLNLVDFSQLELDKEDITRLGENIEKLIPGFNNFKMGEPHILINALPVAVERAIFAYTKWYYKNINRVFRGLPQITASQYVWIEPAEGKENLLANFLCGCIVNWAAAELPRVLNDSQERKLLHKVILNEVQRLHANESQMDAEQLLSLMKKDKNFYIQLLMNNLRAHVITKAEYNRMVLLFDQLNLLFPRYEIISRVENLDEAEAEGHLNVKKARDANPVHLPSVMSVSASSGDPLIVGKNISFFAPNSFSGVPGVNKMEEELLSPHGTSYVYTSTPQGSFFARAVNSPDMVPGGGYWSAVALIEANKNHLKNPYKDVSDAVVVDGVTVVRANHGLSHEYRVMTYIDTVIEYYSIHAENEEFRSFCQHLSFQEREWLRVAAAYSVTGRESEISALENLDDYNRFREASCEHMKEFLQKYPSASADESTRESILYALRWMGNPAFEKGIKDDGAKPVSEEERQRRIFFYRILSTAHKLDLPRCYAPDKFDVVMGFCRTLSKQNEQQKEDYNQMVRYAIELNRAHGSTLYTDMDVAGNLELKIESYRSPFGKVNQNIRQLREVSNSVPRPQFKGVEEPELTSGSSDVPR